MKEKELRRLSLLQMRSLLLEAADTADADLNQEIHAYVNRHVAVAKNMITSVTRHLTDHPSLLEEMRVVLVRQGHAHPVINLLPVDLQAGDLFFLGRNSTAHVRGLSDDVAGEGVVMSDEVFGLALGNAIPPALDGHLRSFRLSLSAAEQACFSQFVSLLYDTLQQDDCSPQVFLGMTSAFWWYVDSLYQRHAPGDQAAQSREQQLFARFIALVNAYARREHTLDFYAARLCLSPRYMSTLVRQVSGRGAKAWIDEALLTAIKVDLRHTSKPLKQIADELCFPGMSFFGKFFKRMTGQTPMAYRRSAEG